MQSTSVSYPLTPLPVAPHAARITLDDDVVLPDRSAFRAFVRTDGTSEVIFASLVSSSIYQEDGQSGVELTVIIVGGNIPAGPEIVLNLFQLDARQYVDPILRN